MGVRKGRVGLGRKQACQEPPASARGLDFADAAERFDWDTAIVGETYPSRTGRTRFMAIGRLDGALVALVLSPLGTEALSAVSLRPASANERKRYARG